MFVIGIKGMSIINPCPWLSNFHCIYAYATVHCHKDRQQHLCEKLRELSIRGGPCGLLRVHICIRNMLAITAKLDSNYTYNNKSTADAKSRNHSPAFAGQSSPI